METFDIWPVYAESVRTALGFFWKAGWAFVLGYAVSAMIQAFVPKARLTRYIGDPGVRSVSLATVFGAASSSCSFAALAQCDLGLLCSRRQVDRLVKYCQKWFGRGSLRSNWTD